MWDIFAPTVKFLQGYKQPKLGTYNGNYSATSTKYSVTSLSKINPLVAA